MKEGINMKYLKKKGLTTLIVTSLLTMLIVFPTPIAAGQATVNLGTTEGFAVLAGTTITNTGTTTIGGSVGGDIGLSPGSSIDGGIVLTSGVQHINDTQAIQAKVDLIAAYDDAAGRTPVTIIDSELGGKTLTPGTYASNSGAFQITGTLTLDAQGDPEGVFIFQTVSTLITASDSSVVLINSSRFCRTFWKVGSSATLGTNSIFVGHIFAMQSIAAQTGATIQGQLLAREGAVTLDSNTITNGLCETTSVPVTTTVTGGTLPDTATPWYNYLLFGICIVILGGLMMFIFKKRKVE